MRYLAAIYASTMVLGLAACANQPPAPSTMSTPASAGGSSAMPQSSNSLPANTPVNAPRAAPTGAVATTPVR